MNSKLRRLSKRLSFVLLPLIVAVAAYVLYQVATSNLHVVSPGQVYRSSRMSPEAMALVVQTHGIKNVFSLIGTNRTEGDTLQRLGVEYFGCSLSDRREVTDEQMEEILTSLRRAPKPILIHCKAGADRTGLVASLYRYAIEGRSAAAADGELTIRYGHMPQWLGFCSSAMDRSYWRYVSNHVARAELHLPPKPISP